jgi:hypothetical protein
MDERTIERRRAPSPVNPCLCISNSDLLVSTIFICMSIRKAMEMSGKSQTIEEHRLESEYESDYTSEAGWKMFAVSKFMRETLARSIARQLNNRASTTRRPVARAGVAETG